MRVRSAVLLLVGGAVLIGSLSMIGGCDTCGDCSPYSGILPVSIALSPDARYAVIGATVTNAYSPLYDPQNPVVNRVQIVDLSTFSSRALTLAGPEFPAAIPDGSTKAAWSASGGLLTVDLVTGAVDFLLGDAISGFTNGAPVALPSSARIAVPIAYISSSLIAVVDLDSLIVSRILLPSPAEDGVSEMRLRQRGDFLYVATSSSAGIIEISLSGMNVTRSIPVPGVPTDVEVSSDGTELFAAMPASREVAEIDLASGIVVAVVATGPDSRLAATGAARKVFSYDRGFFPIPAQGGGTAPSAHPSQFIDFAAGVATEHATFFWAPILLTPPSASLPLQALEPAAAKLIDVASGNDVEMPRLTDGGNASTVGVRLPDGTILLARQIWKKRRTAPNPIPGEIAILGTNATPSSGFSATYPVVIE